MQGTEVYDMYNRLMKVATHAPKRLLVELCRIFPNRCVPSTGMHQPSGEAIGALNVPQPRSPPQYGRGLQGSPQTGGTGSYGQCT